MLYKTLSVAAAISGAAFAAEACTSWMIHPSVSASGRMIVHKCRDNRVTPLDADILRTRHGVKWMRLGANREPLFSVSERGIATVMNDGDPLTLVHPNTDPALKSARMWVSCGTMARQVMDQCTTAADAARILAFYGKNNIKSAHGNSIYVADAKRAFLVDIGPGIAEVKELHGGITIITNCMRMPGIEAVSKRTSALLSDRAREANVRASLRKHRVKGKYTVKGVIATSRMRCQKEYAKKFPCRRNSLSGVCFEIDGEFPQYLTTAYVALGPQQHTIYLPTPMSIEQFPEVIRNGKWSDLAYDLRKREGYDHKYLKRITDYEDKILPEYDKVREEARKLLKEGKKAEAVKLLNDCYQKQFEGAFELLKAIDAQSAADPTPEDKQIKAAL